MSIPSTNIHLKGTISNGGIYADFFGVNNTQGGGLRDITNDNNISLGDLLRKQIILDNTNNRETFALSNNSSITQDSTDSTTTDTLNMNSSTNVEMSEAVGYGRRNQIYSFSGISNMSGVGAATASVDVRSDRSGGCVVPVLMTVELYCKRVGNDLVWFAGEGEHSTGDHSIEGTAITSDTEICRLAGAAANTNVVVSCGQSAFITNTTGGMLGQTAVTSSGSSSSAMTSTNTKVGFRYKTSGLVECATSGTAVRQHFLHNFFINHPDHHNNIQFTMTAGLRGIYTTGIPGCC